MNAAACMSTPTTIVEFILQALEDPLYHDEEEEEASLVLG
jgi:hypothetical protein